MELEKLACSGARSIQECSGDGRCVAAWILLKIGLVHAVQLPLQSHMSSQANAKTLSLHDVTP